MPSRKEMLVPRAADANGTRPWAAGGGLAIRKAAQRHFNASQISKIETACVMDLTKDQRLHVLVEQPPVCGAVKPGAGGSGYHGRWPTQRQLCRLGVTLIDSGITHPSTCSTPRTLSAIGG